MKFSVDVDTGGVSYTDIEYIMEEIIQLFASKTF